MITHIVRLLWALLVLILLIALFGTGWVDINCEPGGNICS